MFEKIICLLDSELERRNIPYMLIGGQAVLLYGEPRLTRDIDITLGADIDKLEDIISLTATVDLKILPEDIDKFVRQTMVLPAIHEETGIRIDFIFSFSPYERQAIKRARKVRLLDRDVSFAAPEDVIVHKIIAGRPRDIDDVKSILLKTKDIDKAYVDRCLDDFAATLADDDIKKRWEAL
jgi:hypothetical protein